MGTQKAQKYAEKKMFFMDGNEIDDCKKFCVFLRFLRENQ